MEISSDPLKLRLWIPLGLTIALVWDCKKRFGIGLDHRWFFSHDRGLREFFFVASFGRSRFRLTENVVSLLLQSCLGGNAFAFKVIQLYSLGFKFSVASKDVGFFIYNLRSFSCKDFAVFFSLWGNGGANWQKEFQPWTEEQDNEWTIVSRKKKSFAKVVCSAPNRKIPILTGANTTVPVSRIFNRLNTSFQPQSQNSARSVFNRIVFPKKNQCLIVWEFFLLRNKAFKIQIGQPVKSVQK